MRSTDLSVIEAPSGLGLRAAGVDQLPEALRAVGILEGLPKVRWDDRISIPPSAPSRDPASGVLNAQGIAQVARDLAERISSTLDSGRFPIVLGGDCSILLGPALALRRLGRSGLFFIDGHADFYSPASEPNGEVASMELAVVTGREPGGLADLDGTRPLMLEEDVVVFAFRDSDSADVHGSPDVRQTDIHVFSLSEVRRAGVAAAARDAMSRLREEELEAIWIHLDADVLNDAVMPAVDYRMPDGLWPDELTEALAVVLASPLAVGMDITIYNPSLDDTEWSAGRTLARTINAALQRAGAD